MSPIRVLIVDGNVLCELARNESVGSKNFWDLFPIQQICSSSCIGKMQIP